MFISELRRQKALFAAADQVALLAALACAAAIHDPAGALMRELRHAQPQIYLVAAVEVGGWLTVFRAFELYRLRNGGTKEQRAIIKACSVTVPLTLVIGFLAHLQLPRLTLLLSYPLSIGLVTVNRAALRHLIRRLYADPKIAIPLVIVGFNPPAHYLADHILEELTQYELLGFIAPRAGAYRGHPVLGGIEQVDQLAAARGSLEAAIVLPEADSGEIARVVKVCEQARVLWRVAPWPVGVLANDVTVDMIGTLPLIGPRCSNIEGLNFLIKRSFDLTVASAVLCLAAPVMFVAALALWLCDGSPLLFRQIRVGIRGRPFELLKFRTMRAQAPDGVHRDYVRNWIGHNGAASATGGTVFKLVRDPRVTRVGRWLRRFSLDELPQLINVLRGDMSLIGPRPALPYELELYQDWHRRRLDAPPGMTGLWQVSGRNHLSFEEMVRLDIEYIEGWSLSKDLRILLRTLPAMLQGNGL